MEAIIEQRTSQTIGKYSAFCISLVDTVFSNNALSLFIGYSTSYTECFQRALQMYTLRIRYLYLCPESTVLVLLGLAW
jgi:hypothetical protein